MFAQVPPELKSRSQKLVEHISTIIKQRGGWVGFDAYMSMALYTPQLGYYTGGLSKFGESGDFITAPEIGDLFGKCLAGQIKEGLDDIHGGAVLEFGAGSGALAATILKQLADLGSLPDEYCILELSSELRARQKETLKANADDYLACVKWLDSLPPDFTGVIIANEVLDAMPVKVFEQANSGDVYELGVALANDDSSVDAFCWQRQKAGQPLRGAVQALELEVESGYVSEINFQAQAWVSSIAQILQKGMVLLIDYGFAQNEYYHVDRKQGTLMCHFRHQTHDNPFVLPGLQDITAHVDFTAVAQMAKKAGFDLTGYTTQGAFLLSAGLLQNIQLDADIQTQLTLTQEVKKLTLPHEMGELFKVISLNKNMDKMLSGFQQQNKLHRL